MVFCGGPDVVALARTQADSNADSNAAGLRRLRAVVHEIETDAHGRLWTHFLEFTNRPSQ
jgi:hypothetical protein